MRLTVAELVRVVEVRKVAAGEAGVGVDQRLDDLRVDLVADVAVALEGDHVLEARALRDDDRRREVVGVAVFVGDVFDEQHEQDVVLVLAGIHAAAQFIARGPEGGVEVGFLDGHFRGSPWVLPNRSLSLDPRPREANSVCRVLPLGEPLGGRHCGAGWHRSRAPAITGSSPEDAPAGVMSKLILASANPS